MRRPGRAGVLPAASTPLRTSPAGPFGVVANSSLVPAAPARASTSWGQRCSFSGSWRRANATPDKKCNQANNPNNGRKRPPETQLQTRRERQTKKEKKNNNQQLRTASCRSGRGGPTLRSEPLPPSRGRLLSCAAADRLASSPRTSWRRASAHLPPGRRPAGELRCSRPASAWRRARHSRRGHDDSSAAVGRTRGVVCTIPSVGSRHFVEDRRYRSRRRSGSSPRRLRDRRQSRLHTMRNPLVFNSQRGADTGYRCTNQ